MEGLEQVNYRVFLVTRKHFVWALAIGMVTAMIIMLAVIPQIRSIFSLQSDLEREQPKLEKLETKLASLDNVLFSPEYTQIDLVTEALPSKKPLLELLAGLNAASQVTQIQIDELSLSPGLVASDSAELIEALRNSNESYDSLRLEVNVQGEFQQIQEFIELVERFAPFTSVTSFSLSEQRRSSSSNEPQFQPNAPVSVEMETETYFFTQSIEVSIDSPLPKLEDAELEVLSKLEELQNSGLEEQLEIQGGGLEDLFGVEGFILPTQ